MEDRGVQQQLSYIIDETHLLYQNSFNSNMECNKTPQEEANSKRTKPGRLKCSHGLQRGKCKECGAALKCDHGRQKSQCRDCGVTNICEHNRERSKCKQCGGASICEHNRVRSVCIACGGGSICEHSRRRSLCKDCGGTSLCRHNRQRSQCKECGGASICTHGRRRSVCKECGGSSLCEHRRVRSRCKLCGGGSICEHGRRRSKCKQCPSRVLNILGENSDTLLNMTVASVVESGGAGQNVHLSKATEDNNILANIDDRMSKRRRNDDNHVDREGNVHIHDIVSMIMPQSLQNTSLSPQSLHVQLQEHQVDNIEFQREFQQLIQPAYLQPQQIQNFMFPQDPIHQLMQHSPMPLLQPGLHLHSSPLSDLLSVQHLSSQVLPQIPSQLSNMPDDITNQISPQLSCLSQLSSQLQELGCNGIHVNKN